MNPFLNFKLNMMKQISTLLLVFIFSNSSFSQFEKFPQDFKNFIVVGGDIAVAPLHFDSKDWILFSSTIAVTAAAVAVDKDVRGFALRSRSELNDNLFNVDKYFFIPTVAVSIAGLYSYGLFAKHENIRRLGLKLGESTVYASILNVLLKGIIGRRRPEENLGDITFNPFTFDINRSSLPSGHTILAFSFSSVMANEIDNIYWKIGWYSLASMVGFSRVYHDKHWASDIILGAALGYFIGDFVNGHYTNTDDENSNVSLIFSFNQLGIRYSF